MPEPVELRMSLELHHTLLEAAPPGSAVEARLQAADTRYDILPGLEHYRWFVGTPDEAQALKALMLVWAPKSTYLVDEALREARPQRISSD
jgi:hypothetical protein